MKRIVCKDLIEEVQQTAEEAQEEEPTSAIAWWRRWLALAFYRIGQWIEGV